MATIFVLFAVLVAFLFFWLVFYKKERASEVKKADASYVCKECGKKDCNCYKTDEK